MSDTRRNFAEAANFFIETIAMVGHEAWDHHGLDQWSVRDLVGHTSRALATVETYLASPGPVATLADPVAYFISAIAVVTDQAAITLRGKEAGQALGPDPVGAVRSRRDSCLATVAGAPDDAILTTPMGTITLGNYLPTRTFELMIHTDDLAAALGITSAPPAAPLTETTVLAARIAIAQGHGMDLCRALTGRTPLPTGFSLF